MARVLVTGCRRWWCHRMADRIVARLVARHGTDLAVVHGGAPGVDTAFARACQRAGVATEMFPAQWDEAGPRAGPLRNQRMVDSGPDFAIAAHRDLAGSKGTRGCVLLCLAANVPVYLLDAEDAEPRRITGA